MYKYLHSYKKGGWWEEKELRDQPCCYAKLDEVISKAKGGQKPTSCLTLCVKWKFSLVFDYVHGISHMNFSPRFTEFNLLLV